MQNIALPREGACDGRRRRERRRSECRMILGEAHGVNNSDGDKNADRNHSCDPAIGETPTRDDAARPRKIQAERQCHKLEQRCREIWQ